MPKLIFINLPVSDVARSTSFYQSVGATLNPLFSNEQASCMVFSETIHAMLLSHDFYRTFTMKEIADTKRTSAVLVCVSADSREEVDAVVERARAAGGAADPGPVQDHGFMYGRSFEDPDGHVWEVMWMDAQAAANGPPA